MVWSHPSWTKITVIQRLSMAMVRLGIAVAPMRLIFIITMTCFIVMIIGSVQP